jgi:hypothetical protein
MLMLGQTTLPGTGTTIADYLFATVELLAAGVAIAVGWFFAVGVVRGLVSWASRALGASLLVSVVLTSSALSQTVLSFNYIAPGYNGEYSPQSGCLQYGFPATSAGAECFLTISFTQLNGTDCTTAVSGITSGQTLALAVTGGQSWTVTVGSATNVGGGLYIEGSIATAVQNWSSFAGVNVAQAGTLTLASSVLPGDGSSSTTNSGGSTTTTDTLVFDLTLQSAGTNAWNSIPTGYAWLSTSQQSGASFPLGYSLTDANGKSAAALGNLAVGTQLTLGGPSGQVAVATIQSALQSVNGWLCTLNSGSVLSGNYVTVSWSSTSSPTSPPAGNASSIQIVLPNAGGWELFVWGQLPLGAWETGYGYVGQTPGAYFCIVPMDASVSPGSGNGWTGSTNPVWWLLWGTQSNGGSQELGQGLNLANCMLNSGATVFTGASPASGPPFGLPTTKNVWYGSNALQFRWDAAYQCYELFEASAPSGVESTGVVAVPYACFGWRYGGGATRVHSAILLTFGNSSNYTNNTEVGWWLWGWQ